MTALLVLALITGEILDYFEKAIALQDPALAETERDALQELLLHRAGSDPAGGLLPESTVSRRDLQ